MAIKPKILEKDISSYFITLAKIKKWYVFRTNNVRISGGKFLKMKDEDKGHPDAVILKDGQTYYIEFKSPTGKQSVFQKAKQKEIEDRGGIYVLIESVLAANNFFKAHEIRLMIKKK